MKILLKNKKKQEKNHLGCGKKLCIAHELKAVTVLPGTGNVTKSGLSGASRATPLLLRTRPDLKRPSNWPVNGSGMGCVVVLVFSTGGG